MTTTPRPGNDWRVYAYTAGGHVVLLSDGLGEDRAKADLETCNDDLCKETRPGTSKTLAGNRGTVLLSTVEAFTIKNYRAVGR